MSLPPTTYPSPLWAEEPEPEAETLGATQADYARHAREHALGRGQTQPAAPGVVVDFADQPELWAKLCDLCRREFRTPENQLLWLLRKATV